MKRAIGNEVESRSSGEGAEERKEGDSKSWLVAEGLEWG